MKQSLILIIFISILYNTLSSPVKILEKGKNITVTDGKVLFNSTNVDDNTVLEFEVKAKTFNNIVLTYKFSNDQNILSTFTSEGAQTVNPLKEITEGEYQKKYYDITKTSNSGKYLILSVDVTGDVTFTSLHSSSVSTSNDDILKKYGTIKSSGSEGGVIMDTSNFKEGDEIYLKISARIFYDYYLYYEFFDNLETYEPSAYYDDYDYVYYSKSEYDYNSGLTIHYYTIKKSKNVLYRQSGKYLAIYFDCNGIVYIENTKENQGKLSTGAIVAIIVVIAFVIIVLILCYCIKKRKCLQKRSNDDNNIEGEVVVQYNENNNYDQNYNKNQNYNNNYNKNYGQNTNQNTNNNNNYNQNYNQNINQNQNYDNNYNQNINVNQNYNTNFNQNVNQIPNQNQNYNNNFNQNYNINSNNQINVENYNNAQQQNYAPADIAYTSK